MPSRQARTRRLISLAGPNIDDSKLKVQSELDVENNEISLVKLVLVLGLLTTK